MHDAPERGVALEVIRALAGHGDVRTTQIYVDVSDQRNGDPASTSNTSSWRWRSVSFALP